MTVILPNLEKLVLKRILLSKILVWKSVTLIIFHLNHFLFLFILQPNLFFFSYLVSCLIQLFDFESLLSFIQGFKRINSHVHFFIGLFSYYLTCIIYERLLALLKCWTLTSTSKMLSTPHLKSYSQCYKVVPSLESHGGLEVNHLHCLAKRSPTHQIHSVHE